MEKFKREHMILENGCPLRIKITKSQASFNSDGVITIRNYNPEDKSQDEIIILNRSETNAIVRLFDEIKNTIINNTIPF